MVGVAYKIWGSSGNRQVVRFDPDNSENLMVKDGAGGVIIFPIDEVPALVAGLFSFIDKHVKE